MTALPRHVREAYGIQQADMRKVISDRMPLLMRKRPEGLTGDHLAFWNSTQKAQQDAFLSEMASYHWPKRSLPPDYASRQAIAAYHEDVRTAKESIRMMSGRKEIEAGKDLAKPTDSTTNRGISAKNALGEVELRNRSLKGLSSVFRRHRGNGGVADTVFQAQSTTSLLGDPSLPAVGQNAGGAFGESFIDYLNDYYMDRLRERLQEGMSRQSGDSLRYDIDSLLRSTYEAFASTGTLLIDLFWLIDSIMYWLLGDVISCDFSLYMGFLNGAATGLGVSLLLPGPQDVPIVLGFALFNTAAAANSTSSCRDAPSEVVEYVTGGHATTGTTGGAMHICDIAPEICGYHPRPRPRRLSSDVDVVAEDMFATIETLLTLNIASAYRMRYTTVDRLGGSGR